MRLVSIDINGFRGFPRQQAIDLDADGVVVVGANGHGKTSLFDAVLWGISGRVPRFGDEQRRLISMYSESGQARVAVTLRNDELGTFTVTRSFDGKDARVALETRDGTYQGPSAEGRVIDLIWPDAASATDPREALAGVFTKSVYLQQDLVRQFVEAATDQDRFAAVSELVGIGRVTELQTGLERSKRAWTAATNQRQDELKVLRQRLIGIESRLSDGTARSGIRSAGASSETWNEWWQAAKDLNVAATVAAPGSREASGAIDNALKQLDGLRRSGDRRLQALRLLQSEYAEQSSQRSAPNNLAPLRKKAATLQKDYAHATELVQREEARLAEVRRLQAELKEKSAQLRALASLALKHLEERCPVCGQTHDKEATRRRLEKLIGAPEESQGTLLDSHLPTLLDALEAKRKELSAAELAIRSAEQLLKQRELAEQGFRKRAVDLGLSEQADAAAIAAAITEADSMANRLAELHRRGEMLALGLAQSSANASLNELQFETTGLRADIEKREKEIAARNRTGERAQRVIEALREAGSAVVQERLRQIAPILQDVYTRIDPHPAFRVVTFLSKIVRGKGHLSTVIADPVEQKESDLPSAVLSSSQVNALAVSVFLALNIGISRPPLEAAMLDDPLQSLDDINLLGLVDLLRRTKDRRQLFVSTHDVRFGSLIARKLRPRVEGGRTLVIELDGWSRTGPVVSTREIHSDPAPLRLAAAS
jgi:exonuclease SbcC